ncbi:MAG: HAD family hydrolase [Deltaproteobacteria bacterium]|nr:MAG: HAD family hydrolase [Deltaproteobacteria bacterium]
MYDGRTKTRGEQAASAACHGAIGESAVQAAIRWDASGMLSIAGRPIEALVFDLGGTLDADGLSWGERFMRMLAREFPGTSEVALRRAACAGDRAVLSHPRAAVLGLRAMVHICVRAQLEALGVQDDRRAERMTDEFTAATSRVLESRRPLLERLASRLPLAVVSNGCGNTGRLLGEAGLADLFAAVVDSAECGVRKPDPAILAPALTALGKTAKAVAVVGDRLDRDVSCAAAAGAVSVWVCGRGRHRPSAAGIVPDAAIVRVEELDPEDAS